MSFFHTKDLLVKKYSLLLLAFTCSLFIPFLLYSFEVNPLHYNSQRTYEYPSLVKYSYKWPNKNNNTTSPSLLNEPSYHQQQEQQQDDAIYKSIDQKYCGQDRCKFLLPVAITEQESKAQLHFRQLAFLSGKIDRTIVLPNVYSSHLGACLAHPFSFYYDQTWLDDNGNKFNYITMDKFKEWLLERHYAGVVPTGQDIYIQGSRRSKLLGRIKNCFQDSFDFTGRPTVNYHVADHARPGKDLDLTKVMMSLLGDEAREYEYLGQPLNGADNNTGSEKQQKQKQTPPVDVINLFYDRRYKFIKDPKAQQPIPYSKRWVDIAEKISTQLKPYIAIHWRMERLEPVSNLLPCAEGLIDEIHKFDPESQQNNNHSKKKHPNVFLLTDYPHLLDTPGARPESNSFTPKQLKPEHHDAIKYLYGHLNISLTNIIDNEKIHYDQLPKENWHLIPIDTKGNTEPIDRSVLGIVDKLVAMKAQWFLAGRPGVCAKSSSFTGRISLRRTHAFRNGDDNIIVPIRTFNPKKKPAEEEEYVSAI